VRANRPFLRNGIWYVWNDRGNRVSLRTRDRAEALRRAAELRPGREGRAGRGARLSAVAARLYREAAGRSRAHRRALAAAVGWLRTRFGDRRLDRVSPEALHRAFLEWTAADAPATRNRKRAVLHRLFALADLPENPVAWRPEAPRQRRPRRALTDAELRRLLDAARAPGRPPWLLGFVALAAATGMRRGELLALRERDVDRTSGTIELVSSKTGARRRIRVPLEVVALLPAPDPHGRLFPSSPERTWRRLLRDAGLLQPGVCFYSLRHTRARIEAEKGTPVRALQSLLGHASLRTTDHYLRERGAPIAVGGDVAEILAVLAACCAR